MVSRNHGNRFQSHALITTLFVPIEVHLFSLLNLEREFHVYQLKRNRDTHAYLLIVQNPKFSGSNPAEVDEYQHKSSGRDFKPWVPSPRFQAR